MLYGFAKSIFRIYFSIFNRVTVSGHENITDLGGLIICSNHCHWLDPLLLGAYIKRNVNFMAKAELFKSKFFAMILRGVKAFPVKRGTGDISAIKNSLIVIKQGKVLGIFPEGTRSKDGKLKPAEPGVALIAVKAKAPVIPVRISGTYKIFGSLKLTIGMPMSFSEYSNKKMSIEEINELSQLIMTRIAQLA